MLAIDKFTLQDLGATLVLFSVLALILYNKGYILKKERAQDDDDCHWI